MSANLKFVGFAVAAGAAALPSWAAAPVSVSDSTFVSYSTNVTKLVAAPIAADTELPTEAGTPCFHFDVSRTNESDKAWVCSGSKVVKIPSLSNDRYLTSDFAGATWTGWSSTKTPIAPEMVYDEELGIAVLDFGTIGSLKALTFDAQAVNTGDAPTNALASIGTVFAVVRNRGGWLMGGSVGGTASCRYGWHRGYSFRKTKDPCVVDAPIVGPDANTVLRNGSLRMNGNAAACMKCGFTGGWDYLALRTQSGTTFSAFGLGINDARTQNISGDSGMSWRSGGIAYAELIVYPTVLSDDICKRIEALLAKKWFDADTRGYGARAVASEVRVACTTSDVQWHDAPPDNGSTGMQGAAEVSADETMALGVLRGGRSIQASFTKTGAGRLELGDASELGGKVVVEEGTLAFSRRTIPTALPTGAALRFDASAEDAVTTSDGYVTRWRNDGEETFYKQAYFAGADSDAKRPTFIENAVNGKPAVDFGPFVKGGASGCVLYLMTNNSQKVAVNYPSTYVAVMAANEGGGCVLGTDAAFVRGAEPSGFWKPIHASSDSTAVWMNGLEIDFATAGYPMPDYLVTAFRASNVEVSRIGGTTCNSVEWRGGLKLCELVVYKAPLSERALEDAQAYLAYKWLGRVLPGYANPNSASARPDVQRLCVKGGSVEVSDGVSVRVGCVTGDTLVKKGGGTLAIGPGSLVAKADVRGGKVETVPENEVTQASALAAEPVFHVAADATETLETTSVNGTNFVNRWHDQSAMRNVAWCATSKDSNCKRPWINVTDTLNGKQTIDFGPLGSGSTLSLARSIDNARAVYVIYRPLATANYSVLGTSGSTSFDSGGSTHSIYLDFLAGNDSTLLYWSNNKQVTGGDIFLDGAKVAHNATLTDAYHLAEFHTLGGAHVSAIARDRGNSNRYGGVRVAEIVIYDRELTARERVSTRNYLLAKWFPSVDQQELPAQTAGRSIMRELAVEETATVGSAETLSVKDLVGSGNAKVVKSGSGLLDVVSAVAYTGEVSVAAGTLRLSGVADGSDVSSPVTSGLVARFDAGTNLFCDASGYVTNWTSCVGSLAALPYTSAAKKLTVLPYAQAEAAFYGLNSVCMPDKASLRLADSSGAWATLSGVKSVFWVIGSQEGGGFILAGESGAYSFHRAYSDSGTVGTNAAGAILHSSYAGGDLCNSSRCSWRKNGKSITVTETGFSGGWDLISANLASDSYTIPVIGGFAADARVYPDSGYSQTDRPGHQRLGEVLFYNRALSSEEVEKTENYLLAKWGFRPVRAAVENGLTVNLTGGSLDCGGTSQYVAGLAGSGCVENGDLTVGESWTIDFTSSGANPVSVDGALSFEPGLVVTLNDVALLPKALVDSWVTVATAESVVGLENLNAAEIVTPEYGGSVRPRFRFRNGQLQIRLKPKGFLILVE